MKADEVFAILVAKLKKLSDSVATKQDALTLSATPTASDVGKALTVKTVSDGEVTEWELVEAGGGSGSGQTVIECTMTDLGDDTYRLTAQLDTGLPINYFENAVIKVNVPVDGFDTTALSGICNMTDAIRLLSCYMLFCDNAPFNALNLQVESAQPVGESSSPDGLSVIRLYYYPATGVLTTVDPTIEQYA